MIRLTETIVVDNPASQVFDYVVDFSNAAEWDPGIESSVKATEGPVEVGTEFDLVAGFLGTTAPVRYRIEEIQPGKQVRVRGIGNRVVSVDTVTVTAEGGRTRIDYRADLTLTGVARLFEPLLRGAMKKMGAKALVGLRETLDRKAAA